ncbi:MAG: hypothetical protein JXB05_18555 [Myxococcaceae bacterium]|nr:hypothetical protein [Myxococcaceae bacterium]
MKRWNFLALGLVLLLGTGVLAQAPAERGGTGAADADASARALAVYEQGKRLYDAKNYAAALEKFDQAAALEPGKARWQYNRGLALRKLKRYGEARDALLQSRTLDPAYKRAEIDDKLREMGFSPEDSVSPAPTEPPGEPSTSGDASAGGTTAQEPGPELTHPTAHKIGEAVGVALCLGTPIALVVGLILLIRRLTRSSRSSGEGPSSSRGESGAPARAADLSPLEQRLEQVASSLVSVEHALRLEEDADLRAMLNQATMAEQRARDELAGARQGRSKIAQVLASVDAAEEGAKAAMERARSLFGDKAFLPEGERVGCYFCARPLANPSFRKQVPLKRGAEITHVLACPPCANMASAGQPPPVKVRVAQGRATHWSELGGYDPYAHRHKPYPGTRMVPAWDFTPQRSLAEVAAIAAGGALVGGVAAYAVSELLDLDGAREAAAAQAATQAAARQASQHREERDWRDHS